MFTQYDRDLLRKTSVQYDVYNKTQEKDFYLISDLSRENSELKTKVEIYESLIQSFLKHNSDLDDISKTALIYNGEIYSVDGYDFKSNKGECKTIHMDLICRGSVTKNFKEEE